MKGIFTIPAKNSKGFTLVELMMAVGITAVIVIVIYSAYRVQQRTYLAQNAVTEMQQNIRAGMLMMSREIRSAGLDEQGGSGAGIIAARPDAFVFTADFNDDGDLTKDNDDTGEYMGFDLYQSGTDTQPLTLGRSSLKTELKLTTVGARYEVVRSDNSASHQPLAENIERIEFYYTIVEDGIVSQVADPTSAGKVAFIRSVEVSILARAAKPDPKFTNTKDYIPASGIATNTPWDLNVDAGETIPYDHYRRRLLITTIHCRNMGLPK